MVVAVSACLIDKLCIVPRQELDGMEGFEVFVVVLGEEGAKLLACGGIVLVE